MKHKILLGIAILSVSTISLAQNGKKITGYAITAAQKGETGWKEVRLVDIQTGEELKSIYKANEEIQALNARTGKPVKNVETTPLVSTRKVVNLDQELQLNDPSKNLVHNGSVKTVTVPKSPTEVRLVNGNYIYVNKSQFHLQELKSNKPFATNSAACAYDKKHERLYYTPMGINQLRYIDLKSGKFYYFEDEPFGVVKSFGDAPNQIPRMVIASDGNGYALSNNCEHLLRFTTGKKPVITDLGALTDDPANGNYSVKNPSGYGGDIIADANKNLYLVTANRNVFKISIDSRTSTYLGTIKGLPRGFTTNGAMVEEGSKVIVASSQSTSGYYRFDLLTLQAEKISSSESVYNASDLANGVLAFEKKKKNRQEEKPVEQPVVKTVEAVNIVVEADEPVQQGAISLYPNPATGGYVKLQFNDQPLGRYQLQLLDVSGKLLSSAEVNITNKLQVEEFRFPAMITAGNYLMKVSSESNKISVVHQLVIQ